MMELLPAELGPYSRVIGRINSGAESANALKFFSWYWCNILISWLWAKERQQIRDRGLIPKWIRPGMESEYCR